MTKKPHSHEDLAHYLRHFLYDLNMLATCVRQMKSDPDNRERLTEVCVNAAALKLRTVYCFFYKPKANSIKMKWFMDQYQLKMPPLPVVPWAEKVTDESLNAYVIHLDKGRQIGISRTGKKIRQPGGKGVPSMTKSAISLMRHAQVFVKGVVEHPEFPGLNRHGNHYLKCFNETLSQLVEDSG